ncbi:MAG: D-sedoheptulose 7-phosphate isomerase [Candidatus Omnitrophota bacterium]
MKNKIINIIEDSILIKKEIVKNQIPIILKITKTIEDCFKKNGKLILCGNGGSASDAQHLAAEFVGRFQKERRGLPAISLTTNTSTLTALSNDYGYDIVFSRQIEALANKNDIVIGISTSGKAKNVIQAIKIAKKNRIKTIALTGGNGGELARISDISLVVPSNITARIQETHILIGHIICELVENNLFK